MALDVSRSMLAAAPADLLRVCGDLAAPPLRRGVLSGAWAMNCYSHLAGGELPLALAALHAALAADAPLALTLCNLDGLNRPRQGDADEIEFRTEKPPFTGRLFTAVTAERARALLHGAGFGDLDIAPRPQRFWLAISARRARTLPDLVRPALRLLVCGLNPSLYSADAGVPFARPGNRFWPAARSAGLIESERDIWSALRDGVGFIDLVKRATNAAAELQRAEYSAGLQRVEALVRRYKPHTICFVGLEGWRAAVDRNARAGWIEAGFAGSRAYLMPSTSGRNASVKVDDLATHLSRAAS